MINNSILSLDAINKSLATRFIGKAPGWSNELWEKLDSTNNRASELASQGAPEGVIVMARQQTAGRGRQGRSWTSPPDAGIYVSFLLRPSIEQSKLPIYTLAAGCACVEAIQEYCGITMGLKWVNDLVYAGKKIGGILSEIPSQPPNNSPAKISAPNCALIIGIGLNIALDERQVPEELVNRIDWLERISGQSIDPNLLLVCLAKHLENMYELITSNQIPNLLANWKKYSITLGRQIKATTGNSTVEGLAIDIAEDGGLIVQTKDNNCITLHAGEISIRTAEGTYV